jgi:hypothetical protein
LAVHNFGYDDFIVYPNPVKDMLYVETEKRVLNVEIIDITGRFLSSNSVHNNKVDLSKLNNGSYFLKFYSNDGVKIKKIIKK